MTAAERIRRRLQISGVLIIAGLAVEGVCLLWSRPIAFVVFAALGGMLIAAGVLCFLYSLVSVESEPAKLGEKEADP
jgi:hypothetical protein